MSKNDIWYGMIEAGEKSTPVVRDMTLQTGDRSKIWLYNHSRNRFLEYSRAIVESKLRDLGEGDISQQELDKAFQAARKLFTPRHMIRKWDAAPGTPAASNSPRSKGDDDDIELDDSDMEKFVDDDSEE
ncbi:MAG: hypothetical protein GC138_01035 [Gammaproteobacteria bacterium]|nr:hypothetical protein [Gammaproteobacteria bacterium]